MVIVGSVANASSLWVWSFGSFIHTVGRFALDGFGSSMDPFSEDQGAANALLAMLGHSFAAELEDGDLGALAGPCGTGAKRRTDPDALPYRGAAATPSSGVLGMTSTTLVGVFESVHEDDRVREVEMGIYSDSTELSWPTGRVSTPPDTGEDFGRPDAPFMSSSERARGSNRMLSLSHQPTTPSDHQLGQSATFQLIRIHHCR